MARSQRRSLRKSSGGRYHFFRSKRKTELVGFPTNTKLDETQKVVRKRMLGGQLKSAVLTAKFIAVASKGKVSKTEIVNVVGNGANPNLVRRNIITKGAVVDTKLGKARVTSRPGQDGTVNGILLQ